MGVCVYECVFEHVTRRKGGGGEKRRGEEEKPSKVLI
jgi:hypothetical protein